MLFKAKVASVSLILLIFSFSVKSINTTRSQSNSIESEKLNDCSSFLESRPSCPKYCQCCNGTYNFSSPFRLLQNVEINNENKLVTSCSEQGILHFPYTFPKDTVILLLDHNHIRRLDYGLGKQNSSVSHGNPNNELRTLSMRHNMLQEIDRFAFLDFQTIETLLLSYNSVSDLSWIGGFPRDSLLHLDLSHNLITTVNKGDFDRLHSLKWLDLSNNDIESIGPFSLHPLSSLEYLDFSSNKISNNGLYQKVFNRPQALSYLSLANNYRITKIPNFDMLGLKLESLTALDLHGLHFMTTIESASFEHMTNLTWLNLSFCALSELKLGWLNGGPEKTLRVLDLSHNRFQAIKSNYFVSTAPNWEKETKFDTQPLPDASTHPYLVSSSTLEEKSQLSFVKYDGHLTATEEKNLYLPLYNLAWLSISHNQKLMKLDDDCFNYLPNLEYLFLQKCNITKLKIASSDHQYADNGIILTLPRLRGLWVFDNPVYCDCYVRVVRYAGSELNLNCPTNDTEIKNFKENASKEIVLNARVYFFDGQCKKVEFTEKLLCYLRQSIERIPVQSIQPSYLFCPEETKPLLISMFIGPLTFGAGIAIMFSCGLLCVMIDRARRRHSFRTYYNIGKHREHHDDVVNHVTITRSNPSKNTSGNQHKPTAISTRPNHGTNLVMGHLGNIHTTDSFNPSAIFDSLNPGHRGFSQRQKKLHRISNRSAIQDHSSHNRSSEIQLVQLSDCNLSNSFPTMPSNDEETQNNRKYWMHPLPFSSSQDAERKPLSLPVDPCNELQYIDTDEELFQDSETEFLVVSKSPRRSVDKDSPTPMRSLSLKTDNSRRTGFEINGNTEHENDLGLLGKIKRHRSSSDYHSLRQYNS